MKKKDDLLTMYRVASYYYNDNLTQNEIADIEGVSRSQISRLLILAREAGIVEIHIHLPQTDSVSGIERRLATLLGLERVLICDSSVGSEGTSLMKDFSTFAASAIPALLADSRVVGIGRGQTVYDVSLRLPLQSLEDGMLFVPLTGSSGTRNKSMQTSTLVDRFAERFNAQAYYISTPCFMHESQMWSNRKWYGELEDYWNRLDAAIFSVANPEVSMMAYQEELPTDVDYSVLSGTAVCEVLGRPLSADGVLNLGSKEYRYIGIDFERLRNVKNTICVACGASKSVPITVAAKLGAFKTLIVDKLTALNIISELES